MMQDVTSYLGLDLEEAVNKLSHYDTKIFDISPYEFSKSFDKNLFTRDRVVKVKIENNKAEIYYCKFRELE